MQSLGVVQRTNSKTGCLIGEGIKSLYDFSIGETIQLEILTFSWNGTFLNYEYLEQNLTVEGVFHHTPGGIGSSSVIVDHEALNSLANTPGGIGSSSVIVDHEALNSLANINAFANIIGITNPGPKVVMASRYLVKVSDDSDVAAIRDKLLVHDYVISIKTIKGEIEKSKEIKQMDFGIPGLLTADFIISLLTARWISEFLDC
jgi:hypothetical protein